MITDTYRTDFGTLLAPYHLAGPGTDPPGAVLAPEDDDELPDGAALGEIALDRAPQGARTVANRIAPGWAWRLTDGEGVTVRQGRGAPRGDGTRPSLRILDPCRSVALRAVGVDEGFPVVSHHAVIVWVQLARTLRWATDGAWAWSTEQAHGTTGGHPSGRTFQRTPRRWTATSGVAGLLHRPPSADAMAALHAPRDAEIRDYADARPPITGRGISR